MYDKLCVFPRDSQPETVSREKFFTHNVTVQLPVQGLIAQSSVQWQEKAPRIAKAMVWNPVQAWIVFRLSHLHEMLMEVP